MDPDVAWDEFALAHAEGRWADCAEPAEALAEWLERGGYIPAGMAERNPAHYRPSLVSWMRGWARYATKRPATCNDAPVEDDPVPPDCERCGGKGEWAIPWDCGIEICQDCDGSGFGPAEDGR
jgi:hypothetical protein